MDCNHLIPKILQIWRVGSFSSTLSERVTQCSLLLRMSMMPTTGWWPSTEPLDRLTNLHLLSTLAKTLSQKHREVSWTPPTTCIFKALLTFKNLLREREKTLCCCSWSWQGQEAWNGGIHCSGPHYLSTPRDVYPSAKTELRMEIEWPLCFPGKEKSTLSVARTLSFMNLLQASSVQVYNASC